MKNIKSKWISLFSSNFENKNAQFKRFVLDAKFYDKNTFNKAGGKYQLKSKHVFITKTL